MKIFGNYDLGWLFLAMALLGKGVTMSDRYPFCAVNDGGGYGILGKHAGDINYVIA